MKFIFPLALKELIDGNFYTFFKKSNPIFTFCYPNSLWLTKRLA